MGTVYILHLHTKLKHALHYTGFAINLDARLAHHAKGTGARMLAVARQQGISWELGRTFEGQDKTFERKLKRTKAVSRYCTICNPMSARNYKPKCQNTN